MSDWKGFNPLISGADRATRIDRGRTAWSQVPGFNPLISGADRATGAGLGSQQFKAL